MKVMGVSNPDMKAVIKVLKSRYKDWDETGVDSSMQSTW